MNRMPKPGTVGLFDATPMFRGVPGAKHRVCEEFATDPGDYGCGQYYTNSIQTANNYAGNDGAISVRTITVKNAYTIPLDELRKLIREYGTCKIEDGRPARLERSKKLTEYFKSKGYAAVVTINYESFDEVAICIFDPESVLGETTGNKSR